MYMLKENTAVVTKCLGIQHVPSNMRNCASYSNCMMVAFLYVLSIYAIQNQHYTMHASTKTSKVLKYSHGIQLFAYFVTSPFKTVHFQIFFLEKLLGCIFTKLTRMKSK